MDYTVIVYPLMWVGVAFLATIMLSKSFKILRADQGIEVYLFAQHRKTILPIGFVEGLTNEQRQRCGIATKAALKRRKIGTAPLDIVFRLWPFYSLVRFSTTPTTLILFASEIVTKKIEKHPRVRLEGIPAAGVRFLTVRNAILGVGFTDLNNLTTIVPISGQGPTEERLLEYQGTVLAKGLREEAKSPMRDALRKTAGSFYYHSGDNDPVGGDELEINASKRVWEKFVLFELASPESVFAQSHILVQPESIRDLDPDTDFPTFLLELRALRKENFFGEDILSMDTNIPKIGMARKQAGESEAQTAINARFVAIQTAAGAREQGAAEADVIQKKGEATANARQKLGEADAAAATALQASLQDVDPNALAGLVLLKDKQNVNITPIGVGQSLTDIVRNLLGGK